MAKDSIKLSTSTYKALVFSIFSLLNVTASFSQLNSFVTIEKNKSGFPSEIVYEVFQDSDKFLWFSTQIGISRYDGKNFKNYDFDDQLPDNVIFEIRETRDNKKWFLSGNGKLSYLSKEGIIKHDSSLSFESFISELIESEKGEIVVSSFGDGIKIKHNSSVYKIDKTNGLPDNYVSFICNRNNDILAISSFGISVIKPDKSVAIIHEFNVPINFSRACKINDEGDVILSMRDNIYLFTKENHLKKITNSEILTKNTLNKISVIKNDILAACTDNGVYFFTILNDSINIINKVLNIPSTSIIIDHENSYWVSTIGEGFISFLESNYSHVGIFEEAYCFATIDSNIYIGYDNYTYAKKEGEIINYFKLDEKNKYSNQKIKSIFFEKDTLWFLLDGGLASYYNKKTSFYRTLSGDILFNKDSVLVGGKTGYFKISRQFLLDSLIISPFRNERNTFTKNRKLKVKVNTIKKYKTQYLIGTENGMYVDNGKEVLKFKHKTLSQAKIKGVFVKGNNIVISTYGYGVFLLNGRDTIQFNKSNGLISNFCQTAYINENKLFIGTNKGLNIIHNYSLDDYKVSSITKQDGLLSENIQDIIVSNGKVLLATLNGVISFNQTDIPEPNPKYTIPIFIERLRVNDSLVNYNIKNSYSYDENRLSFEVTPISYKYSDRLRTFYKLSDLEKWKEFKGNYLEFNSLNPGHYQLSIKAVIDKKDSKIVTYNFTIRPPFWKTWWFTVLLICSIILLVYWFFKIRVLTYNRDVVRELIQLFIDKLKKEEFIISKNVKDGSATKIILNHILFIKAAGNYIEFYMNNGNTILIRTTMKEVLSELKSFKKHKFIRCHKSYIINGKYVVAVHGDFIKIKENKIPIGKQYLLNSSSIKKLL